MGQSSTRSVVAAIAEKTLFLWKPGGGPTLEIGLNESLVLARMSPRDRVVAAVTTTAVEILDIDKAVEYAVFERHFCVPVLQTGQRHGRDQILALDPDPERDQGTYRAQHVIIGACPFHRCSFGSAPVCSVPPLATSPGRPDPAGLVAKAYPFPFLNARSQPPVSKR